MKRVVERIGPLLPALATVASICVSSLLLATGPQTLGPQPVVPPFTREVGRVVASVSPPAPQLPSRRPASVARSPGRSSRSAPPRRPVTSTPSFDRSSRQAGRVEGSASPQPSRPRPPPPPPATPQPTYEPATQVPALHEKRPKDGTRPGWGHGDPNHDHTGPPGKGSKRQEDNATTVGAGAPAAVRVQDDPSQNGERKSPGH
jgi:hypothetical protein